MVKYSFLLFQLSLLQSLIAIDPVVAETPSDRSWLTPTHPVRDVASQQQVSTSAIDLLAQASVTRVTGIEVDRTDRGLEIILKTVAGQETLVPLIVPQGNELVIDILDATLSFSIRNGVTELNPAPGIDKINLSKLDESSIRLIVTGENTTPSAEVVPSRQNLVLNVTSEGTTAEREPDKEIEIIATGQQQEGSDYFVPDAGVGRTDAPIINTPSTVQVIPSQVIEDRGTNKFSDALITGVGVTPASPSTGNFNNVIIRGFNSDLNYLRNGLSEGASILQPPRDLNNVDRLEILSGPASVVGGRIAPGGLVNVVTKQPLLDPFYELSASYGSFNTVEGALDFTGSLNESKTVAYRLNTAIFHSDTLIDTDDVDIDRFSIAPVLSWQIGKQTKIAFEGLYVNSRTPQRNGLPAAGTVLDNPNGEVPRDQFVGEPDFDGNDRKFTQIGYDLEHKFNRDWSLRHAFTYFNYQLDQREAFVNDLQDDFRTLERSGDLFQDDINSYQVTAYVTGEFATGKINHELLAGVDYVFEEDFFEFEFFEAENIDLFEPEFAGGVGEAFEDSLGRGRDTRDGVGLYLQDQIKIFDDRLILVLGGRVDFVGATSEDLLDEASEEDSQDDTAFSPRVGILYKVADNISLYGSFSRSFEQEIGRSADNETFEPTRGTQYEVGAKANWLDNRLSTTLAFYDLTQTNVLTEDPEDPDFEIQTGEQNSQGIELQTTGEILPDWKIIASYAYTNAEITEDNVFTVGNSLQNVPENALTLWNTYTISKGNLSGLGFGLGLFYVGEREGDLDNSFQLDDYFRTDAAIYYRRDDLNLALNFKNLFDVDYIESADDDLRVFPADPFTVQFTTSYKF